MPQMMPMPWLTLFSLTVALVWLMVTLVFFQESPNPPTSSDVSPSTLGNNSLNLDWVW